MRNLKGTWRARSTSLRSAHDDYDLRFGLARPARLKLYLLLSQQQIL
jgi:hypothetical protein